MKVVGISMLAVALVACGARGDSGDSADDGLGPAPTAGDDSQAAADGMFGTIESPCGPTPEGMQLTDSDQGVTAETITVGTISDPGGPVPGLNQGFFDTANAFVEWCNAQGGINGRELVVELLDAGVLQYQQRAQEACGFAFALVGGGGTFDDTGAQDIVDCGLVNVPGFTVSPEAAESDLMYQPQPNPIAEYTVGTAQWLAEQDPEAIQHAASLYTDVPTTQTQQRKHQEAYEKVGFEFIYEKPTNINESNWAPIVVDMRNQGVEYVTLTSSWEEAANMQKAMLEQGFDPTFTDLETNFYNPDYLEAAGEAAEGTLVRLTAHPFEEADEHPATQQYLDALRKTNGDDVAPEMLGVQGWSAFLLFATAAKAAGGDLTREALLEELAKIDEWDGGGLHGTNNPAENSNAGCFMILEVKGGEFVRKYPEEGLDCDEDNRVTLEGDYGEGAKVGG
jgi:ABC-type branched-subunit amino acid transport system substrate-binding protein